MHQGSFSPRPNEAAATASYANAFFLATRAWGCTVPTVPRWRDSGRHVPSQNYLFFIMLFFIHANRIQMQKNKTNTMQKY
jgi:hypothetical protein